MFYFISSNGMLDLMGVAGLLVLSVGLLYRLLRPERAEALAVVADDTQYWRDRLAKQHAGIWKGDRPSDYASYASVRKSPHVVVGAELVLNGSVDRVQIPEKDPEAFERYLDLP